MSAAVPLRLCESAALAERGSALVWDLLEHGQPVRAFALRFDGRVVAYLNRCAHVPAEMDWQPGRFLDSEARWIVCSIHGAVYEPADGRCAGGPCGRGRLRAIATDERDGTVYWYPSAELQPVGSDPAAHAGERPSGTSLAVNAARGSLETAVEPTSPAGPSGPSTDAPPTS